MSIIEKAINKQSAASNTTEATSVERAMQMAPEQAPAEHVTPEIVHPESKAAEAVEESKLQLADADDNVAVKESKSSVTLDLQRLEQRNFVSLSSERRLINEEYRVIKRKLITNAFGPLSHTLKHPNLILVSSSRPGEGKTFSSINLALSIALEQDKTVLLVDSDVLRPSVSKTLNISHHVGLTDYLLSSDVKVSDIILSTNVERLKIVTAGRPHHLSTELLASERMLMLVNEFASRYSDRIVIFDAPPLLGVNETAVMASMCGQAVIVVEENSTKLAEIEQAVALLPKDIATGFIINKAHRNQGKGYGYGYYYGAS